MRWKLNDGKGVLWPVHSKSEARWQIETLERVWREERDVIFNSKILRHYIQHLASQGSYQLITKEKPKTKQRETKDNDDKRYPQASMFTLL